MNSMAYSTFVLHFSTINNKSISGNRSNLLFLMLLGMLILVEKKKKKIESSPHISRHIFQKLLNTSASNNVSL